LTAKIEAELAGDIPVDPMRPTPFEPHTDTVMGHEFCCEVIDVGPGVSNLRTGDVVVGMPIAFDDAGVHALGYSNRYPGGYAEMMVLNELMAIKVPAGVPAKLAALTEPFAVGVHAVNRSQVSKAHAAIVLGLGPVGLACVAELARQGIGPIVGADFSPRRRAMAEHLGCDVVVDPSERSAIAAWYEVDGKRPLVIFEAVGVPGMIEQAMRFAPRGSQVLVVGACMQEDRVHPMLGIGKELSIQFVLGYEPLEFSAALTAIAEGQVDLGPLLTGSVGIAGVPQAFTDLGNPEQHAKILVEP
jgi:threonine dehydrogenase-like Zn-dependent dehydrogenase